MGGACCSSEGAASQHARSYLDERYGHGTSDALQRIVELLGRVEHKVGLSASMRMSHPVMVNLGMVMKQAQQEQRYPQPLTSGVCFEDATVLRKAARYCRYASAAYYNDKRAIADYIGGLHTDDIKHVHQAPTPASSSFFVAIDPETDDIVLCIRGATSAAEALASAVAPREPFSGRPGACRHAGGREARRRERHEDDHAPAAGGSSQGYCSRGS